ncbi:MAG: hypothetical protein ACPHIB_02740 [Thalassobaculaceae bacterium]
MVTILYKHWTKGHQLEITGTMPLELNNPTSDRYVVRTPEGHFEDILKHTVISIEQRIEAPFERPFVKYQQSLTELNHDGNYGIGREGETLEAS